MNYIKIKLHNIRSQYYNGLVPVFIVGIIFFALALFNAIISYIIPGVMLNSGLSESQMGIILSSSSVFGILMDFILNRYIKSTNYIRMIFYTIVLMIIFPFTIIFSKAIGLYILGMAIWALFTDLWNFAFHDFVSREAKTAFHVSSFALMSLFNDLGYVLGTMVSTIVEKYSDMNILYILLGILIFASALLGLIFTSKRRRKEKNIIHEQDDIIITKNTKSLLLVARKLSPLLIIIILIYSIEAVTWTVTPVISRIAPELEGYGGIILALSFIFGIFAYALSDPITKKFGKKKTAVMSFILSSILLIPQGLVSSAIVYLFISSLYSFISGFFYPALGGAFADYLSESKSYDNEIMVSDSMIKNIAYIIGPALGGILMQLTNSIVLFTYLGIFVTIIGIIIFITLPKNIDFRDRTIQKELL